MRSEAKATMALVAEAMAELWSSVFVFPLLLLRETLLAFVDTAENAVPALNGGHVK